MIKNLSYTLIAALLLLSGCASSVTKDIEVATDADPKANFAGYKSYAWLGSAAIVFDDYGQWEPPKFDADAEIRFLIDRELREHGMVENASAPDMIVAYAAGIDMDSMEFKTVPESEIDVLRNVPRGALSVILIDAETGLAIWAGVATAEIQESPDVETTRLRLEHAVSTMFDELPH
jgi:hypothetical protein